MADDQRAEKEEVQPLSFASPTVHPITDVESGRNGQQRGSPHGYLPTRHSVVCCCGCCGATVLLFGVTILVLALTVFKVKDPQLTMNNLHLDRLLVPGIGTPENPISVNATLTADISIKNPNVASFRFRNSTTEFFYEGVTVGAAYAPDGFVKARRTARMNVTVDVMTDRVVLDTNATSAVVVDGAVKMSSFTDVRGKVDLLGIYKRNLDILLNCTFTVDVVEKTLANRVCLSSVK